MKGAVAHDKCSSPVLFPGTFGFGRYPLIFTPSVQSLFRHSIFYRNSQALQRIGCFLIEYPLTTLEILVEGGR